MAKQIVITGVNSEKEDLIASDILTISEQSEIERRITSMKEKGSDRVIITLPCSSVYNQSVESLNDAGIQRLAKKVFNSL